MYLPFFRKKWEKLHIAGYGRSWTDLYEQDPPLETNTLHPPWETNIQRILYTDTRAHHGRKYTVHTIYTRWEEVVIRKTGTTWGEEEE